MFFEPNQTKLIPNRIQAFFKKPNENRTEIKKTTPHIPKKYTKMEETDYAEHSQLTQRELSVGGPRRWSTVPLVLIVWCDVEDMLRCLTMLIKCLLTITIMAAVLAVEQEVVTCSWFHAFHHHQLTHRLHWWQHWQQKLSDSANSANVDAVARSGEWLYNRIKSPSS